MTDLTSQPLTILVADDDPDLVVLVARRLAKAGYDVITASDGAAALELAQRSLPHLAVLDVMMPNLTGIEVMRELRAQPATRNIPVILLSAGFPGQSLTDGSVSGADDYISKPFGPRELPERVRDVLLRAGSS